MNENTQIQVVKILFFCRDQAGNFQEIQENLDKGQEYMAIFQVRNTGQTGLILEGLNFQTWEQFGLVPTDGKAFIDAEKEVSRVIKSLVPVGEKIEAGEFSLIPLTFLCKDPITLDKDQLAKLMKSCLEKIAKPKEKTGSGKKKDKENEGSRTEQAPSTDELVKVLQGMIAKGQSSTNKGGSMGDLEGLLASNGLSKGDLSQLGGQGAMPGVSVNDLPAMGGMNGGSMTEKNKPKLIISNYKIDPEMPRAGEDFTLNLDFFNTNRSKAIRNIKITMNAEGAGSSTGSLTDMLGNSTGGASPQSGSIFIPVNSSNTFYIEKMAAGKHSSQSITLKAIPTAPAQTYSVNLAFEYEDMEGNQYTAQEVVGIPVVQKAEILLGDPVLGQAYAGQPMTVDLDFYNTGKDNLTNFMVNLEGSGFTSKESTRYFVGNFSSGQSDHYSMEIIPEEADHLSGQIVLTYEDSAGQVHEEKVPFNNSVERLKEGESVDAATGQILPPQEEERHGGGFSAIGLVILLVLAGLAVVIFRRRSRKKKASAEELKINED
ncbi:COG1361 S-layer family protein [Kallipyga gabonensis]|uniref:COG1361 S-layer family protein n=1 Tax=Kallipyga gabonensis TaxID=1686287 RepID=UPI0006B580D8|nr:hypothetical protein [Kallipyga gabonensis]